ncbi:MAG: hypothetical protein WC641_05005 [Patescibacteria group bacterium]
MSIQFPQHTDPYAKTSLLKVLEEVRQAFGSPVDKVTIWCEQLPHPDFECPLMCIYPCGMTIVGPLSVTLFPRDTIRRRRRTYAFQIDGKVKISDERESRHVHSAGPDDKELEVVDDWPQGTRHLIRYLAQVFKESASWEQTVAKNLEALVA